DVKAALDGARAILLERFAEDAELVGDMRQFLHSHGRVRARVIAGKETEGAKYRDYFDHVEPISQIPSHRLLALFRASKEGIIDLALLPFSSSAPKVVASDALDDAIAAGHAEAEGRVAVHTGIADQGRAADRWLLDTVRQAWRVKLHLH